MLKIIVINLKEARCSDRRRDQRGEEEPHVVLRRDLGHVLHSKWIETKKRDKQRVGKEVLVELKVKLRMQDHIVADGHCATGRSTGHFLSNPLYFWR
jgi:hypothetical protein